MARVAIYTAVAIFAALSLLLVEAPVLAALLSGLATGLAVPAIDTAVTNSRYFRFLWASIRNFRQEIRISVSYLYRIESDGRYFFVRGNRIPDQFQPVGGVYKFNPSARSLMNEWRARTDDLIPIDETSQEDLRIRIPGQRLVSFVRWFESGQSREVGPWREFYEELIRTGIFPSSTFPYTRVDFVRRHYSSVQYSPYSQCNELLIADIYELLPDDTQRLFLKSDNIHDSSSTLYTWADAEQVKRRGAIPGQPHIKKLSATAEWIL